ncbi:3-mercaptopyruvate sulfurtransferase [Sphingomonas sp. BK345]|uniref:3-mercaptopyruvate sulfurtransferase n=1 Tax=Sphingomonas sp. BK345 TaxID=2586980 RepID=UPI00160CB999|nr:3-mercaptopyruvate sulfurtransferase [Sphingomonas sp. BK345]MBB3475681.1 thiosulfate/3-mercaptopyruvate sulfurtransferase [Sphingomonas sp. BK345]
MDPLVSATWLADQLGAPDLRVLDASYDALLPGEPPRDHAAEYRAGHVPGALYMDLAGFSDAASDLPSTMPGAAQFAERAARLGIDRATRIVLYDDAPHHTAARAWVMLRAFGFNRVALLDGGLAAWKQAGLPLEQGESAVPPRAVDAGAGTTRLRDLEAMRAIQRDASAQIVDARSAARFTGAEPDPRTGVAPGHIPGARNLPYKRLFDEDGRWKRGEALAAAFRDAGVDLDRPMVMTCGSGITASVLAFGAHLLGRDAAVYDGSWTEWGADPSTPKATGAA